jgi:FKBP-type peptidyl-prolyl cis-trans isomerase FkpA
LKQTIALAAMALTALCANAQAPKAADKTGCVPPPKELVIKDLAPGTGDRVVVPNSAVLVVYTGWLYDGCAKDLKGEQFDTSVGRTTPFGFMVGVGKVIKGWDEGIVGMKEKEAKRLLVIPPEKGYGAQGAPGGKIPPNSTLVFEVQTINIVHYPQPAAAPAAPAAPAPPKSK